VSKHSAEPGGRPRSVTDETIGRRIAYRMLVTSLQLQHAILLRVYGGNDNNQIGDTRGLLNDQNLFSTACVRPLSLTIEHDEIVETIAIPSSPYQRLDSDDEVGNLTSKFKDCSRRRAARYASGLSRYSRYGVPPVSSRWAPHTCRAFTYGVQRTQNRGSSSSSSSSFLEPAHFHL
jgi:hypothetical protein